jgi:hypothetical protein
MTNDRAEKLARQIRSACGRYNNDNEAVILCVDQMRKRIEKLEAKLVVRELTTDLILEAILPVWKDPYTNNGDSRADTNYRHGWNDCRAAVLAALTKHGMD